MPIKCIEVKNLSVKYSESFQKVLSGITLSVIQGQIYGFLGPNGAGKTTFIKTLIGVIPSYEGEVLLFGKFPSNSSVRAAIGFMPETAQYYGYLTPGELLTLYGQLCGMSRFQVRNKIGEILALVGLENVRDCLIKTFSKGMVQKVNFAQALINDPQLLILDEPTSGLDPLARIQMREILVKIRDEGKTVFFSSHELSEVETICDQVAIIHKGHIVRNDTMANLMKQPEAENSLEQYFLSIIQGDR